MQQRRVEQILGALVQRHITGRPDATPGELALRLADSGFLVLVTDSVPGPRDVQAWLRLYGRFYTLLAEALFPSFTSVSATYADDQTPPVVIIQGECAPVITAMARYVLPYVAMRQHTTPGDLELRGLLRTVLDDLEAGDLPTAEQQRLAESGLDLLRQILVHPVREAPLYPDVAHLFGDAPAPEAPPTLPVDEDEPAPEDSQAMRFNPITRPATRPRRPLTGPLPPIPPPPRPHGDES